MLCWCALVQARINLNDLKAQKIQEKEFSSSTRESLFNACSSIEEGLKIARDCGFCLYHIDLLLEKAFLHLLQGEPQQAHNDLRLALDTGVPASNKTGQPELLAATDKECRYGWAIAKGLSLFAETILLMAAQELGCKDFTPSSKDKLPKSVQTQINNAEKNLKDALDWWYKLREPESKRNNNFCLLDTDEEYNFKAKETFYILEKLRSGILTEYPLHKDSNWDRSKMNEDKIKTVVELDLIGYTNISKFLEGYLEVEVVAQLDDKIQQLVDIGLAAVQAKRNEVVKATAGDNALIVFDSAERAHRFSVALHRACAERNLIKKGQFWFRIGIATGPLYITEQKISGTVIIDAVRLETAGSKGHVLIDTATYNKLPEDLQLQYREGQT